MKSIVMVLALSMVATMVTLGQPRWQQRPSEDCNPENVITINGIVDEANPPRATLRENGGTRYEVHLGPVWFWDRKGYQLAEGARVEMKGWSEEFRGSMHFYPTKISQDGTVIVLRDEQGTPEWTSGRNPRARHTVAGNRGFGHRGYRQACPPCPGCRW